MKIIIFTINLLIFYTGLSYGQVTIGAGREPKATLDIVAADAESSPLNGLLVPRFSGDDVLKIPVTADQNSMLVYAISVSTETVPKIFQTGYWYYDHPSTTWRPLVLDYRRNEVTVNPGSTTADYKTLQEAYNSEARKMYTPTNALLSGYKLIAFRCTGNVGPLVADGAIPSIRIQGPSESNPAIVGNIELFNTSMTFGGGVSSGDITMTNSYMILNSGSAYSTGNLVLNKSLIDVKNAGKTNTVKTIKLNQSAINMTEALNSTMNVTATIAAAAMGGGSGIYLQAASSFKCLASAVVNFQAPSYTNCVLADDASFFDSRGTINVNSNVDNATILAQQFSSMTIGSIIYNSGVTTNYILRANTGGKIQHYAGSITNAITTANAFEAFNGGIILLGGVDTADSSISGSGSGSGVRADGGEIRMSSSGTSIYTLNNYQYLLNATAGGAIYSLSRVKGTPNATNPATAGAIQSSGSVIYM